MSAEIIRLRDHRPLPKDDGTVMGAAARLVAACENFEAKRARIDAEAAEWEAKRQAAQDAYFARKRREAADDPLDAA